MDSGPETEDIDFGCEETRAHVSGVNDLKYKEGPVSDVGCIAEKKKPIAALIVVMDFTVRGLFRDKRCTILATGPPLFWSIINVVE